MASMLRFRGGGNDANFQTWLERLKKRGSNILITGNVPDWLSAEAARVLFGHGQRRYRILALVDRTIDSPESRLPESVSPTDPTTWIIDQRNGERSIPVDATSAASYLRPPEKDNVRQLRDEIQTAISFYEERSEGLLPAELRVGIDSLFPLLQRDRCATKQSLRTLTATVRGVHGMGQYHLRVHDEEDIVRELTPLFDARIELRRKPGMKAEQRWHVPELDKTTVWVEL
ncbi:MULTISPECIES: hypothetical protein [unclassified Haladaptatus]|uniref:DUF7504 family protein n=1 Tax=unclassified Haladaptatus TaxID=2622732 RepID=UPI00209C4F43|nr:MULTISPECIES: hypothetical protein [unclassified Haladaptatus]MCO8244383.1 hypothetical protein [Haladaptatus sp. AB643]MCO8253994.1 hypothetical protein [Haladaptatus sp. AB618]